MKVFVNLYFSDFKPLFFILGGLFDKIDFTNKFCDGIFHVCQENPQEVFWIYFTFFKYFFLSIFVFSWEIGELRELCANFWNS